MTFDHRSEHRDDGMLLIQANLDDMNPEYVPYVTELLLEKGANDVYWIPILMKKGRPGIMLNVLAEESQLSDLEEIIFRETTTLGLRYIHASCHRLGRSFEEVETRYGSFRVKVGYHRERRVQFAPEYRECEEAARTHQVPLKDIYEEIRRAYALRNEELE